MASRALSIDEILGLVNENASPLTGYPPPRQYGPLRWYDKEMRCLNSEANGKKRYGCHSPTYAKVQGVPMCTKHAMIKLNELLIERGME